MSTEYLGSLSIGQVVPALPLATGAANAALNVSMPGLQGQIAGLQIAVPIPSIAASLDAANQIVTNIGLAISLGAPDVSFQAMAIAELLAALLAQLGLLQTQLDLVAGITASLSEPGVHLYRVDQRASLVGADISSALSGGLPGGLPTEQVHALLLATAEPLAWTAIQNLFKTS